MNLIELGRNTFPFWWPGAALFVILLLYFLARPRQSHEGTRWHVAQTFVAFLAYSILCLAITLSKHYFLATSHLIALALAMLAASCFLVGLYFERAKPLMSAAGLMLFVTAASASYGNWFPQVEGGFGPPKDVKLDVYSMTPQRLADEGEKIIFGGIAQSHIQGAIGKGYCPLCHNFWPEFPAERAPNLYGITETAWARLKDPRYHLGKPHERDTIQKEAFPSSGTATTAIEYIAESLVCPSCYVVAGYGIKGTDDKESPGVMIHKPPTSLKIDELIAVTTWLHVHDGKKPPAPEAIENAFRKFIPAEEWSNVVRKPEFPDMNFFVRGNQSVQDMFAQAHCLDCHYVAGIQSSKPGVGSVLTRNVFLKRLKSTSHKATDSSVREYIRAAILDQKLHHWADYGNALSEKALKRMVEYLSAIDIEETDST